MAKILVHAAAYLGDVAPFLACARTMQARGHDVTCLMPEGFRRYADGEDFAFVPSGTDFSPSAMQADPTHRRLMRFPNAALPILSRYWMNLAFNADPDRAEAVLAEHLHDADMLVVHPTASAVAVPIATSVGVPSVVGHLFPMLIPSAHYAPPMFPARSPASARRAQWGIMRAITPIAFGEGAIADLRRRRGLPPIKAASLETWTEADATVMLASRHYFPHRTDDWPDQVQWGGFTRWQGPGAQSLDPDLQAYVDEVKAAGDPLVVVTLGSLAASYAGKRFETIARDLDSRGIRSVLLVAYAANPAASQGRRGAVQFAPLTQLLPQVDAAVVSGALGGVAAALSAGVPTVVHPQIFDQRWNGTQVRTLGVGGMATRPGKVADVVAGVIADPAVADRARTLSSVISADDGAVTLADTVDRILAGA